jgi:hypothetical protein
VDVFLIRLTWPEFRSLFPSPTRETLDAAWSLPDVTAFVLFENPNPDSPAFGARTAIMVGPAIPNGNTVADLQSKCLKTKKGRQIPVAFVEKTAVT